MFRIEVLHEGYIISFGGISGAGHTRHEDLHSLGNSFLAEQQGGGSICGDKVWTGVAGGLAEGPSSALIVVASPIDGMHPLADRVCVRDVIWTGEATRHTKSSSFALQRPTSLSSRHRVTSLAENVVV